MPSCMQQVSWGRMHNTVVG